jgi:regulator of CtrA degradation
MPMRFCVGAAAAHGASFDWKGSGKQPTGDALDSSAAPGHSLVCCEA